MTDPFRNPESKRPSPESPFGLVIGGSSCVGKTMLAKSLCARFGLGHYQTDHILPNDPTLNPLAGPLEIWDRPPEHLFELLVVAASAATPYLAHQIEVLSEQRLGWIVEGERIHPELVEHLHSARRARGLFVVETDVERLHKTIVERLPGFKAISESRQRCVAEVDRLYNLWLLIEATRRGLDCVPSQTWPSLPERVLSTAPFELRQPECDS